MSKIVKRTLDFFELFERTRRPLSLSGVARELDLPASSCHDVLRTLVEHGFVYQPGERGEYYPTQRLGLLAAEIARNDPFLLRVRTDLRDLSARHGRSCFLARIDGETARYVLVVEAYGPWRYHIEEGAEVRHPHATSAGKALLGQLTPEARAAVIAALPMPVLTPQTIQTREELAADVEVSRARGWYLNKEESVRTAMTISVPLHWNAEDYILTMAGPGVSDDAEINAIAADLAAAARRLEAPR